MDLWGSRIPQQNHSWGKDTPGRENARIGTATHGMYTYVLIHSFHSENSDAPERTQLDPRPALRSLPSGRESQAVPGTP